MEKETECPCANAECERRGDCIACYMHHMSREKPIFCLRPESVVPEALLARVRARLRVAGVEIGAATA